MKKLIKNGRFREDLFYRIAKATTHIPPLREGKEDIPVYVNYFLRTINRRFGTHFKKVSNKALLTFMNHDWPGNIRELINALEQACLAKWEGEEIPESCLPSELSAYSSVPRLSLCKGFKKEIKESERKLILWTLEKTGGNKRRAASLLSMPRSTLYKKIREYSIKI